MATEARADAARQRRFAAPLAALLLALAGQGAVQAQQPALRADSAAHVEAAYLVNFLRYTEWPLSVLGEPGAPLLVSVVGSEDAVQVVAEVAAAAGQVDGRPIEVRAVDYRSRRDSDSTAQQQALAQLRSSHLVFVDRSAAREAGHVADALRGVPVLAVSNVRGFIESGGMLELLPAGRNIVFAANAGTIRRAGLVLSSRVLALARHVEGMP